MRHTLQLLLFDPTVPEAPATPRPRTIEFQQPAQRQRLRADASLANSAAELAHSAPPAVTVFPAGHEEPRPRPTKTARAQVITLRIAHDHQFNGPKAA